MAIPFERIVQEDINVGHGTVNVTMPGGGSAVGNKINYRTFADGGVLVAALPAASLVPGAIEVVTDATVTTAGSIVVGGGANRVLVFSNGTAWKIAVG